VGITNLTTAQVTTIFSGDITNWAEVGGANAKIILYVRDEGDSSTKGLRQVIFGDTPFPEAQVITSQSDMQAAVAGTLNSVGFGSWPAALAQEANVQPISLNGVPPNDSACPISAPIGIGYLTNQKADVQPLLDWLLSEQGQVALQAVDVIALP
jgi:phosphate transport system substrate-binding protein